MDKNIKFRLGINTDDFKKGIRKAVLDSKQSGKDASEAFKDAFKKTNLSQTLLGNMPRQSHSFGLISGKDFKKAFEQFKPELDVDTSKLDNAVKSSKEKTKSAFSNLNSVLTPIFQGVGQSLGQAILSGVGNAINSIKNMVSGLISNVMKVGADAENVRLRMNTMLGEQEGGKAFKSIRDYAAKTPFKQQEVAESGTMLLNVQGVNEMQKSLETLGNIAAGTGSSIREISFIYMQVLSAGRVNAEDMNQLAERGIPIYQQLSQQLGVTGTVLRDMISKNQVSVEQFEQALTTLSTGKYNGAVENLANTFGGVMSTLKDTIDNSFVAVFDAISPTLTEIAKQVLAVLNDTTAFSGVMQGITQAGKELLVYFKENPQVIKEMVAAGTNFLGGVLEKSILAIRDFSKWMQENVSLISLLTDGFNLMSATISTTLNVLGSVGSTLGDIYDSQLKTVFEAERFDQLQQNVIGYLDGINSMYSQQEGNLTSILGLAGELVYQVFESGSNILQEIVKWASESEVIMGLWNLNLNAFKALLELAILGVKGIEAGFILVINLLKEAEKIGLAIRDVLLNWDKKLNEMASTAIPGVKVGFEAVKAVVEGIGGLIKNLVEESKNLIDKLREADTLQQAINIGLNRVPDSAGSLPSNVSTYAQITSPNGGNVTSASNLQPHNHSSRTHAVDFTLRNDSGSMANQPIRLAEDVTITHKGASRNGGNFVRFTDSSGIEYEVLHLAETVKHALGEVVKAGDVLGIQGWTGLADASKTHTDFAATNGNRQTTLDAFNRLFAPLIRANTNLRTPTNTSSSSSTGGSSSSSTSGTSSSSTTTSSASSNESSGSSTVSGSGLIQNQKVQNLLGRLNDSGRQNLEALRLVVRELESDGNYQAYNQSSGTRGAYQFKSGTRSDVQRDYKVDAWSSNQQQQDAAFTAYALGFNNRGNNLVNMLNNGNINGAANLIRGSWTALPGTNETSPRLAGKTVEQYAREKGYLNGSSSSSTNGSSTPSTSGSSRPLSNTAPQTEEEREREAERAAEERQREADRLAREQATQVANAKAHEWTQKITVAEQALASASEETKLAKEKELDILRRQYELIQQLDKAKTQLTNKEITQTTYDQMVKDFNKNARIDLAQINKTFDEATDKNLQEELKKRQEEILKQQKDQMEQQRVNLEFQLERQKYEAELAQATGDYVEYFKQMALVKNQEAFKDYLDATDKISEAFSMGAISQHQMTTLNLEAQSKFQSTVEKNNASVALEIAEREKLMSQEFQARKTRFEESMKESRISRSEGIRGNSNRNIEDLYYNLPLRQKQTESMSFGDDKTMALRRVNQDAIRNNLASQLTDLEYQKNVGEITLNQYERTYDMLTKIAEIDLNNVNKQFLTIGETIEQNIVKSLQDGLQGLLTGSMTLNDVLLSVVSNLASVLANQAVSSLFGGFGIPMFSSGTGLKSVGDAMGKERGLSGNQPLLAIVNSGEAILNSKQVKALQRNTPSFSTGTSPNLPLSSLQNATGITVNIPITMSGIESGGASIESLRSDLENVVTGVLIKHQRNGGLLKR